MKRISVLACSLVLLCGMSAFGQTGNANYPEAQLGPNFNSDIGAVNAMIVKVNGCGSLYTGETVKVLPAYANTTTTPTLAYCGLAAKTLTKCGTSPVAANDLTTTAVAIMTYDGTYFQLLNPQATGCGSGAGTVSDGAGSTTVGAVAVATSTAHTQSYNANYILASGGYPSTFDNLSTAGLGNPVVLGVSDVTAQSASQSTVNLIASTSAAGHYLVRLYLDQNAVCTTGTGSVYATVSWTDASHAHTAQTVPLTLANTTVANGNGYVDAAIPLWSATSSAISYTTTYGACGSGTGSYDLHAEVERTN
jgi:hypothetical protein